MDVEIDHCGALDPTVALEQADGHGDIVEDTEPFAVIREGVVRATGEVHRDAVTQRCRRGLAGAADRAHRAREERRRPREPDPPLLVGADRPVLDARHVSRRMHEQQCIPRRRRRLVDPLDGDEPLADHPVAEPRVLLDRKAMTGREWNHVPRG
jgi:hypothetical protein